MEKEIKIRTNDDHLIYGTLSYTSKEKKIIIFVHGLCGHRNRPFLYNGSKFFNSKGFSTFRFDLYSIENKARKLKDCSTKTHTSDLNCVLNYFKNKYKKIYLIGHSLGGPTILLANAKEVNSIVLWDPSFDVYEALLKYLKFNSKLNCYILDDGRQFLLSKNMVEEWKLFGSNLLKCFSKPTKIIYVGKGIPYSNWRKYIDKIKIKHKFKKISNASHSFSERGVEKKLFEETLKWIKEEK